MSADLIFIVNCFEKVRNTINMSNSMDPDQARRFVRPNPIQNLFGKKLSVDN